MQNWMYLIHHKTFAQNLRPRKLRLLCVHVPVPQMRHYSIWIQKHLHKLLFIVIINFVRNDFQSFGLLVFSPLTINIFPHPLLIRSTLLTEFSLYISVLKITGDACPTILLNILWAMSPKEGGIDCRLWNIGFPSSIIMQSLGLTKRSLSSVSLTMWRRAFDLSVFARNHQLYVDQCCMAQVSVDTP